MTNSCKNDSPELIRKALEIIGDKYSALIIRMMHEKPQRFKDLEQAIKGISPRTLSQRLSMLEMHGIIDKAQCPESPGRCHYQLTQSGKDLDQVIHSMAEWSRHNLTAS